MNSKKIHAIGDTHGCVRHLRRLVEMCGNDMGSQLNEFVLMGDYIDRGPDSSATIEFLMDLQGENPDRVTCLLGNHEALLLSALDDPRNEARWLRNGGNDTLRSYGVSNASEIPATHIAWLETLPTFYDDGLRLFVHAGVHPDRALNEQDDHDLINIREPFLSSEKDFGRLIVHGHTPTANGLPDQRPNRLNIDTGAVFGRTLTAAVFTGDLVAPQKFFSVSSIFR